MTENKIGRPPVEEKRSHVRNVRFTEREGADVEAAAVRAGVPFAVYVREAAVDRARSER